MRVWKLAVLLAGLVVSLAGLAGCPADDPQPAADTTPVDTAAPADTASVPDTSEPADTWEPPDTTHGFVDTAPVEDAPGDTSAADACDPAACDELDCAPEHLVTEPGACCPVCAPPPPQCEEPDDCVRCVWGSAPTSVADCYCPMCPSHVTSAAECAANQAAWETHCPGFDDEAPCPVPRCISLAPPICASGQCVVDPEACNSVDDCTRCRHTITPTSADECECPGCGVPMLAARCEANQDAVWEWCIEMLDACLPPPCAPPPPMACDPETWRCTHGSFDDVR